MCPLTQKDIPSCWEGITSHLTGAGDRDHLTLCVPLHRGTSHTMCPPHTGTSPHKGASHLMRRGDRLILCVLSHRGTSHMRCHPHTGISSPIVSPHTGEHLLTQGITFHGGREITSHNVSPSHESISYRGHLTRGRASHLMCPPHRGGYPLAWGNIISHLMVGEEDHLTLCALSHRGTSHTTCLLT